MSMAEMAMAAIPSRPRFRTEATMRIHNAAVSSASRPSTVSRKRSPTRTAVDVSAYV